MSEKTQPPLDPAAVDHDGVRDPGAPAPDTELDASLTPTEATTDPRAAEAASRSIEDDPALSVAAGKDADALAALPRGAARGSNLLLYVGVLVALGLVAAALWAALR
jgi:hypothetical protein